MNVRRVAENYRQICIQEVKTGQFWDIVVLTASDDKQRQYYEGFLEARRRTGLLPFRKSCMYMVVADPPTNVGNRIGAGGATFWALAAVKSELIKSGYKSIDMFNKIRILMIHSGGYASRNPNCCATGKIFAPIPSFVFPGLTVPTLFDFKMAQYAPIADMCRPGLMIVAGDVCNVFDPFQECFYFVQDGCIGIGHLDNLKYASDHGVYVVDHDGFEYDKILKCNQYCHKFQTDELVEAGANIPGHIAGENESCIVDSDYFVNGKIVTKLLNFYETTETDILSLGVEIDCYGDFLSCFGCTEEEPKRITTFGECAALQNIQRMLWNILKEDCLFVIVPKQQKFYHIGTMAEYSSHLSKGMNELLYGKSDQTPHHGERIIASNIKGEVNIGESAVLSSTLHNTNVGNGTIIEFSSILAPPKGTNHFVGDNCILSGIFYSRDVAMNISSNLLIVTYPLLDGTVTFIFGTGDDMKQTPIKFWGDVEWNCDAISKNIMSSSFSSLDQTTFNLFSVPMFPVCHDPCDSLLMSLSVYYNVRGDKALAASYANQVQNQSVLYHTSLKDAAKCKSVKRLTAIRAPPPGVCLQAAVLRLMGNPLSFEGVKQSSEIHLPARLVIAGGWTDTPPQCLMAPGGVFNIAITVDGKFPLQASVTTIQQTDILELVSDDQMVTETFSSWDELYKDMSLNSAVGLHKVCIAVLFDVNLRYRLGHHVQPKDIHSVFPSGFRLSTRSFLPKGSGLGASSILALAIVQSLKTACGLHTITQDQEMNIVLSIEQVLGSGGGWQDQIGTLPGCKFTSLESWGYNVSKVELDKSHIDFLNDRFVCLCTDMTRVAQKVLIGVIDKYNAGFSNIVHILMEELPANAASMKLAFDNFSNVDITDKGETERAIALIGKELSVYRKCCEGLEGKNFLPESIAKVVEAIQPATYGCNLMGAGSGGFLLAVRKEKSTKEEILSISTSASSSCPDLKLSLTSICIVP